MVGAPRSPNGWRWTWATPYSGKRRFSRANLLYVRSFAKAGPPESIVQQAVGRLPLRRKSANRCRPLIDRLMFSK